MPIHITVQYTDQPVVIGVRIKRKVGDATFSRLSTAKPMRTYGEQDDFDYSDEWREREQAERE